MRISILCSNQKHPVNSYLEDWMRSIKSGHEIELVRKKVDLSGGDILFLISCSEIITKEDRSLYTVSLVLHASDLPKGRGWSPHVWEISTGADHITLSLIEVEENVDSGAIWKKTTIPIEKHLLWYEINHLLFTYEIEMMDYAVNHINTVNPCPQSFDKQGGYYPLRTPENSEIDPNKTIAEQFDLMRVCEPDRYPVYFNYLGYKYCIRLEKI